MGFGQLCLLCLLCWVWCCAHCNRLRCPARPTMPSPPLQAAPCLLSPSVAAQPGTPAAKCANPTVMRYQTGRLCPLRTEEKGPSRWQVSKTVPPPAPNRPQGSNCAGLAKVQTDPNDSFRRPLVPAGQVPLHAATRLLTHQLSSPSHFFSKSLVSCLVSSPTAAAPRPKKRQTKPSAPTHTHSGSLTHTTPASSAQLCLGLRPSSSQTSVDIVLKRPHPSPLLPPWRYSKRFTHTSSRIIRFF